MSPFRIILAATAIEGCFAIAVLAGVGLGGAWNGWLDVVNCGAPLFFCLALACALAARMILDRGLMRTACVIAALFAALFEGYLLAPDLDAMMKAAQPYRGAPYRIVTANVLDENVGPFHAARDIVARGANAVFLQETNGTATRARSVLAHDYAYSTSCPDSGVQIWVKTAILAQGCGLSLPQDARPGWGHDFIWIKVIGPDGAPMILATAHLGRPYPPARQSLERQALIAALARLNRQALILTGDFNTVPWSFAMRRQDRYFKPLRRRTLFRPTWPAQINMLLRPWNLPFLPIDHIYTGPQWGAARLTRFRVAGSDHFATQADLMLAR